MHRHLRILRHMAAVRQAGQRGAAIVTALLVVALATVVVSALFYRESVAVRSIENRATLAQTRWIERAVIDWAKVILRNSRAAYDWSGSIWATPVVETQLDETVTGGAQIGDSSRQAMMAGKIHDAQARFNVNALVSTSILPGGAGNAGGGDGSGRDGTTGGSNIGNSGDSGNGAQDGGDTQGGSSGVQVSQKHLKALKQLMQVLSLPENLADQILQRVRRAAMSKARSNRGSGGGENWVMPLLRFDDLRDLPGFNDDVMLKLEPHLTVLPEDATTVNLNTASAEVLEAVAPNWSPASIRAFVANRDVRPAESLQSSALGMAGSSSGVGGNTTLDSTLVNVKSAYFIADGIIRYDRVESHTQTLLRRQESGAVQVIWQHRN
ncbi:MAG: type II secretion system minor pseudopilin GspK [Lautropia sp.]|nr:type II secretion system minor pseudopilin GspK [Lautropia sp.]